ncbi:DUF3971 domain-containing protein [Epibacterium ulvae]|uniref:YhdP family protein n=1 Tax=Epibacterium ulvae TaxID=1156985 RepID=UPI00248FAA66|nr:DUF3971 domain-containing protein [Epibacterium ulvae]
MTCDKGKGQIKDADENIGDQRPDPSDPSASGADAEVVAVARPIEGPPTSGQPVSSLPVSSTSEAHDSASGQPIDDIDAEEPDQVTPDADPKSRPEQTPRPRKPRRRRWGRRIFSGIFTGGLLFGLAAIASIYSATETEINLPPSMRTYIEDRIEPQLDGLGIEFGAIRLVIDEGWHPRIGVQDVQLTYPDGRPAVALADAQASVSMAALMRGEVQPTSVYLSGLLATLRRAEDGVAVSFADGADALRQAQSVPQLIEDWEQVLTSAGLSQLEGISVDGVTLRYEDLRIDRAWTLDGGYMTLDRAAKEVTLSAGFSVLSGGASASLVEASYTSDIGDTAAEFGISFSEVSAQDIAVQTPALEWLNVLRVPISGALRGGLNSDGELNPVAVTLELGEGALQPTDETRPIRFTGASSYFTYYPKAETLQFDDVLVDSAWGSGRMEGLAQLEGLQTGHLSSLVGQLRFTDLTLNPANLYDAPRSFAGLQSDFKMELDPFRIKIGETHIQTGDSSVLMRGDVSARSSGWRYNLDVEVDRASAEQVKALWPAAASPKPRAWVRDNILAAEAHDVRLSVRGRPGEAPFVSLNLGYRDADVRYHKDLPVLKDAAGQFSIHGTRLVAIATSGHVTPDVGGSLDVTGTSFIIPDTTVTDGSPGVVRLQAEGAVTAALSLLDRPPLQVMEKADLPVDLVSGYARASGTLALPLKDGVLVEDIKYHYTADIFDAETEKLVPGHVLGADQLRLTGDQSFVALEGEGTFSGIPATARWTLPLGENPDVTHQVVGQIELSDAAMTALNIGLPARTVFGQGQGRYVLSLPTGAAPRLTLESDLRGVGLQIPALSWRKGQNANGQLAVDVTLGDTPRVDNIEIEAAGLRARGDITLRANGGLERARFAQLQMGSWLRSGVTFTGRGTAPPAVSLNGGVLDLRTAPFTSESASSGSASSSSSSGLGPITYALDRVQVTDSIALHGARGRVSALGGVNGQFAGRLNGDTPVNGVLVAQPAGTAMRIQSEDAGGVFRSAGLLRHGVGGSFDMTFAPSDRPGHFEGQIRAENTRITDAPAVLALINSLSLIGLVNELAGQGLLFTSIDAKYQLGPTHFKLVESSAVGPSIGLSMDGIYDLNTGALNMRGVLSPIYLLNAVGSFLTRKGEGLIGFAFNLRGTADDPKVQVNPLSGLAPGFLREVFRGEAPLLPGETPPEAYSTRPENSPQARSEER